MSSALIVQSIGACEQMKVDTRLSSLTNIEHSLSFSIQSTQSQGFCIGFPFDISKDIEQAVIEAHQLVKSVQTNPVGHKNLICRFE